MPGEALKDAVQLIKAGQKQEARQLLLALLKSNPQQEQAWLWLVETATSDPERISMLRSCLKYNPRSELAQRALDALSRRQTGPLAQPPAPEKPQDDTEVQLQEIAAILGVQSGATPAAVLNTNPPPPITQRMHQVAKENDTSALGADLPIERPRSAKKHLPRWIWISLLGIFVFTVVAFGIMYTLINTGGNLTAPPATIEPTATRFSPTPRATATPESLPTNTPRATWTPYYTPTPSLTPSLTPTPSPTPTITPLTFNTLPRNRQVIDASNLASLEKVGDLGYGAVYAPLVNWVAKVQINEIIIWDASSNYRIARFNLESGYAMGLAISDSGNWVAASNTSFLVRVWNVPAQKLVHTFGSNSATSIPPDTSTQMHFSSDDKFLVVSNKGTLSVWDLRNTQQPVAYFGANQEIIETISTNQLLPAYFSVDFSPNNQFVAASGYQSIIITDLTQQTKVILDTPQVFQHTVRFSLDGQYLAVAGPGFISLLDPANGQELRRFNGAQFTDQQNTPFAFVPGNSQIAILVDGECCGLTQIDQYNLSDGELASSGEPFDTPPSQIEYSPNGDLLVLVIPGTNELIISAGERQARLTDVEFLAFTPDQTAILARIYDPLMGYISPVLLGVLP